MCQNALVGARSSVDGTCRLAGVSALLCQLDDSRFAAVLQSYDRYASKGGSAVGLASFLGFDQSLFGFCGSFSCFQNAKSSNSSVVESQEQVVGGGCSLDCLGSVSSCDPKLSEVDSKGVASSIVSNGVHTASVLPQTLDSLSSLPVYGKNHSSNVRKRASRRAKRRSGSKPDLIVSSSFDDKKRDYVCDSISDEKRLKMQGSWRSSVSDTNSSFLKPGFFSECDSQVRKDLRESRAKMLIAQNNLRAEKATKDLEAISSVQGVVQQMLDVATSVAKLQKQSSDQAVQGWAKTVASSMAKSITESSSSVPSLDSIGFGASGLRSTDGEVLDHVRLAAYERDIKYVEDSFADMECYTEDDYKYAINSVKASFPDIALTKSQREALSLKEAAMTRLLELGVDYQKARASLYPDDE